MGIVFIWLGIVSPGLRKLSWSYTLGMVLYVVAAILLGLPVASNLPLFISITIIFTIAIIMKIIGLTIFLIVAFNFRRINKGAMDYFRSKKICIVHRGKIKGKAFMCATCGVLYCANCKEAIVQIENRCWSCKTFLDANVKIIENIEENNNLNTLNETNTRSIDNANDSRKLKKIET